MCKCVKLNKNNMEQFEILNGNRLNFNILNDDFFSCYNNSNMIEKLFLKRTLTLLISNRKYVGYIWANLKDKSSYIINSLNVCRGLDEEKYISQLLGSLKVGYSVYYTCESNGHNIYLLERAGFRKIHGTVKMELNLDKDFTVETNGDVSFKFLEKGKEENIRCAIQNEVFKNETRVPISIRDIYFDQCQDYYFDDGAIFIMKNGIHIGYGQIILDNSIPVIVNVGILKEYRGKGYGKALINYLLKMTNKYEFNKVLINVDWNNKIALELYKKCGFKIINEQYDMETII